MLRRFTRLFCGLAIIGGLAGAFAAAVTAASPSTGEIIDTKSKKIVVALKDEKGRDVHSEKMIEIDFKDGVPVRNGDQFGVGRAK